MNILILKKKKKLQIHDILQFSSTNKMKTQKKKIIKGLIKDKVRIENWESWDAKLYEYEYK